MAKPKKEKPPVVELPEDFSQTVWTTLDALEAWFARARAERPTCDKCEWLPYKEMHDSYLAAHPEVDTSQVYTYGPPEGFESHPSYNGAVKRCAACAVTPKYPWLDKVRVERALEWLNGNMGPEQVCTIDEIRHLAYE